MTKRKSHVLDQDQNLGQLVQDTKRKVGQGQDQNQDHPDVKDPDLDQGKDLQEDPRGEGLPDAHLLEEGIHHVEDPGTGVDIPLPVDGVVLLQGGPPPLEEDLDHLVEVREENINNDHPLIEENPRKTAVQTLQAVHQVILMNHHQDQQQRTRKQRILHQRKRSLGRPEYRRDVTTELTMIQLKLNLLPPPRHLKTVIKEVQVQDPEEEPRFT